MSIENPFYKMIPEIEKAEQELINQVLAKTAEASGTPVSTTRSNMPAEMSPGILLHQVFNAPRPPILPTHKDLLKSNIESATLVPPPQTM